MNRSLSRLSRTIFFLIVIGLCCGCISKTLLSPEMSSEQKGRELLKFLSQVSPTESEGIKNGAFRDEIVAFDCVAAQPGACNDLMAGDFYIRVINSSGKDLRPHACFWQVLVKGRILKIFPDNKIIVLAVEDKDWQVEQAF